MVARGGIYGDLHGDGQPVGGAPAEAREWVLRKRGYFYRPNSSGYTSSIHEAGRYTEAEAKAHAAKDIEPTVTAHLATDFQSESAIPITQELIDYITRYGSRCRECADERGVCPSSGMPCANPQKAISHVIEAYNYGVERGFLNRPR